MSKTRLWLCALVCALLLCALPSALAEYAVVQNTNYLNIRSGPGTEYPVTGSVNRGDFVDVVTDYGQWVLARTPDGLHEGFMSASFLARNQADNTAVVNNPKATSFLNLRQYPSYDARVLGIYYNGAVCVVISEYDGWCYVSIDGMNGYFRREFLRFNGGQAQSANVYAANGKPVNLRNGPGYGYGVLAKVPVGAGVSVMLRGGAFSYLTYGGLSGFMDNAFLSGSTAGGYGVVTNPRASQVLYLRKSASKSAKVLGQYRNGDTVQILAQGKSWCKVSVDDMTGYMMTQYLALYGLPETPAKTVRNGSSYVNLREKPSKNNSAVYTRVPSGRTVTVLTPGDSWTEVSYGRYRGYMMTSFLK